MYGSIHTHLESLFDTANNLSDALNEFQRAGAKRIAVTEHGDFTSFEELKDIAEDMDIKVIPGVEGYFNTTKQDITLEEGTEDKNHLILIAKDEEGYKYLSNIITRSNEERDKKDRIIITWNNLISNIKEPGHLYCTSACIAGPFGDIFRDDEAERERIKEYYMSNIPYDEDEIKEIRRMDEEYEGIKDRSLLSAEEKDAYKENRKKKALIDRNLNKINERLSEIYIRDDDEKQALAADLYYKFCDIFGEDNFFLEIQNHFIDKEQEIYPKIIEFAKTMGIEDKLIASNDIHIAKTNPTEEDFLKRNVTKFRRFNTYSDEDMGDRELYIKDDDKLKEALMQLPYEGDDKEEIIDKSIKNIETLLSSCEYEYTYDNSKRHYPKFCDDENALFDKLVDDGIKIKFPNGFPDEEYEKRLSYEKDIIKNMGYAGYHLIVQDYLDYGRYLGKLPDKVVLEAPHNLDKLKEIVHELEVFERAVLEGSSVPTLSSFFEGKITEEELEKDIKEHRYSVKSTNIGPGRGSAAGSLCCYLLGITDVDPMKYGLLFERFLNPERVSMPDIDADFRTDIRQKCIDYCADKYGNGKTSKILTKSYGDIKGNLRDAARYIGDRDFLKTFTPKQRAIDSTNMKKDFLVSYRVIGDRLAKMVDDDLGDIPEDKINTFRPIEEEIYNIAKTIKGLFTGYGEHAAGNIISADKISDIIPLKWNAKKKDYSTQCSMADAEAKGLLKMDFLGLDNLDILTDIIRKTGDDIINDYSKRDILLSDKKTFEDVYDTGFTQGVFQFESDGMKKMLKDFRPDSFEDIILLIAAYRPGPMQYLPEIIARKQYIDGRRKEEPEKTIDINSIVLDEILKPTYGCLIYQEQVMKVCTDLAGYSMGQADNVRKYMSKKKKDALEHERDAFIYGDEKRNIPGCVKYGDISADEANKLFDQMMDFASYAFNKSHATAYALVSFFTAYYKAKYPGVFYEVSLNHIKELKEVAPFRAEMGQFDISLRPPCIGKSEDKFALKGNDIYYGFSNVKGLSSGIADKLSLADDIVSFIIENKEVSKSVLLALSKVGALDDFGDRQKVISYINDWQEAIVKRKESTDKYMTLSQIPDVDKRKLAGAKRSYEQQLKKQIPDFKSAPFETVDTTLLQDDLLGTVFLDKQTERKLASGTSFRFLKDKETSLTKFYCIKCSDKEQKDRFGKTYYTATFMDKDYDTKTYYIPHKLDAGLYEGYLAKVPWSSNVNDFDKKFTLVNLFTKEAMVSKKDVNQLRVGGVRTRLNRLTEADPDKKRDIPVYYGIKEDDPGKEILGYLAEDEYRDFMLKENEKGTIFRYQDGLDEDLTLD